MARTLANKFWNSTADQDQAWGTDIRALVTAAPAADSTTINNHGTGTAQTEMTADPYSTRTTISVVDTLGWGINESAASNEGMDSTSASPRFLTAGNWFFSGIISLPIAGTTTGTLTCSIRWRVYRVAAGGGTRTQLFTATSGTAQSNGLAAVNNAILTAASAQPAHFLLPGETILVTKSTILTQTAGLLGAVVTATATLTTGADDFIQLPGAGIRSYYSVAGSDTVATTDSGSRKVSRFRAAADSVPTTDSGARSVSLGRAAADAIPTADSGARTLHRYRAGTEALSTADSGNRTINVRRSGLESLTTNDSGARTVDLKRGSPENIPTTDSGSRSINVRRGATENLASGAATIVERPVPVTPIIVDDDIAVSLGGNLYTKV